MQQLPWFTGAVLQGFDDAWAHHAIDELRASLNAMVVCCATVSDGVISRPFRLDPSGCEDGKRATRLVLAVMASA